jgi:hypothetical protein
VGQRQGEPTSFCVADGHAIDSNASPSDPHTYSGDTNANPCFVVY